MTLDTYTEICVLVDRSGSMEEIRSDTEGGFNAFIRDQQQMPGRCLISLAQFDDRFEWVYSGQLIGEVPQLQLKPRGSTALLDAMGRSIVDFGHRLSQIDEEKRPGHVVFVVMTDGLENASVRFSREQVMNMVREQTDVYSWSFLYLGANQDAIAVGESIGVAGANSLTYAGQNAQQAWAATSNVLRNVRSAPAGAMAGGYTEKDREMATTATSTGTNAAE